MRDSELEVPVCLLALAGLVLIIGRAFYTKGFNFGTVGSVAGSLLLGLGAMSAYAGLVELFKRIDDIEARKRIRKEGKVLIAIGLPVILIGLTLISLCR